LRCIGRMKEFGTKYRLEKNMAHEAGKGDAPRKTADPKKYAEGWERIFGHRATRPQRKDLADITAPLNTVKESKK